jgi:hypothetical protein
MRRRWSRVAYLNADLPHDLADALWEDPRSLVTLGEPLRKVGARSTVRLQWNGAQFVLKHYVEPTLRHALKQNVSRSRARTTWCSAHRLADAGIATPRPVAWVENRFGPFRGDSYLLYPYVQGQTLHAYLECDDLRRRQFFDEIRLQLVSFWNRLKQLQISLADTNLRNFIVGDTGRLWVIDVDKVRFHRVAYLAARHHQRGWRQLTHSASRTGAVASQFVDELRMRSTASRTS